MLGVHCSYDFNIARASVLCIRDLGNTEGLVRSKQFYFQTQESVMLRMEGYLLDHWACAENSLADLVKKVEPWFNMGTVCSALNGKLLFSYSWVRHLECVYLQYNPETHPCCSGTALVGLTDIYWQGARQLWESGVGLPALSGVSLAVHTAHADTEPGVYLLVAEIWTSTFGVNVNLYVFSLQKQSFSEDSGAWGPWRCAVWIWGRDWDSPGGYRGGPAVRE